ncbi:coiled-coil domain-containing protein [Pigmentibacter ruber]|uniref:hypothetical protein n=1 Tax=Pigmentibacter ruber TaxID=2683196 RepID=UPI00131DEC0B|nr:hypothetical protein [Pigmentibacter ruber]
MLGKNILVATLSLTSIALYSCGGKNNKTAAEAKKNSETKKINTNFVLRTGQNWQLSEKITIEGKVKCASEKSDKPERILKISSADPTLVVIADDICNITINKIIDSSNAAASVEWVAEAGKELELVLNTNKAINFSDKFGEFKNSSNTMYLNAKKEENGALNFFFKDDNKVISPTVANSIVDTIDNTALTKKLLWSEISNGAKGLGDGYTVEYSYVGHRELGNNEYKKVDGFKLKINGLQQGVFCAIGKTSDTITLADLKAHFVTPNPLLKNCPTNFTEFVNEAYTMYTLISLTSNQMNTYKFDQVSLPTKNTQADLNNERAKLKEIGKTNSIEIIKNEISAKIIALDLDKLKSDYGIEKNKILSTETEAIAKLDKIDSDLEAEMAKSVVNYNQILKLLNDFISDTNPNALSKTTRSSLTTAQIQEANFKILESVKLQKIEDIFANL